ncbi:MAG: hypothetical protein WCK37_00960 [Candidatus Falkowbacteria bacterium]
MFKILKSRLLILVIISLLMISPVAVMAAPNNPGLFNQAKDFMVNKVGHFFGSIFGGETLSPIVLSDSGVTVKTTTAPKTSAKKATTTKKATAKKTTTKKATTTKKTASTAAISDTELKNIIRKEIAELLKMTGQIAIEETNRMRNYLKKYSSIKTLTKNVSSSTDADLADSGYDYSAAITPSATFVLSSFSFLDSLNSLLHVPMIVAPSSAPTPTSESSSTNNNATSTENILSSDSDNASSSESAISTSTEIISTSTETIIDNSTSTEASDNATSTPAKTTPLKLLISRLYVTGDNDLIELYNPMSVDIDLAAGNYRLEKTKTAVDPAILMRFGNPADGTYPGGTIIKSGGTYLIVRDKAEVALREKAQAIATTKTFTFDSSGYTIYLGDDSISGPTDENIIDYVGYGTANFYEGLAPAPEISDNYILQRKTNNGLFVDTDSNSTDFSLVSP